MLNEKQQLNSNYNNLNMYVIAADTKTKTKKNTKQKKNKENLKQHKSKKRLSYVVRQRSSLTRSSIYFGELSRCRARITKPNTKTFTSFTS